MDAPSSRRIDGSAMFMIDASSTTMNWAVASSASAQPRWPESRSGCGSPGIALRYPGMWPAEAIEFLKDLEANNDRDWFKANRERYDAYLVEPARELAAQLGDLGSPHLFRPYNDTRFHMRPPIKEQLGLAIGYGGAGGYYVELSLDGLLVAAGMHAPASDQLARFRAAIDDGRRAASFERAVRTAEDAGLETAPPQLKRAPKGIPSTIRGSSA